MPRRLNVNTFHDNANDGLTESYAYENANIAQMFISVYDA